MTTEPLCRIRDILRTISEFEASFQARHGIGLNEGMLLCSISKYGKCCSGEVAGLLGLTSSNTSKVIASAEKKKLVKRIIGKEDKRQMYFSLTQAGEKCLKHIKASPEDMLAVIEKVREV